MGTVPFSNETDQYGIWPSSNMAVLSDGVTTVGMFPMVEFASSSAVYNTMVTVNVTDPKTLGNSGPPTNRIVNQFFYANEPLYGGLSILKGDLDGLLYMFASVSNGVKLARVREDQMTDRSKFEYWDGKKFQSKMPQKNDPAANVLQFSVGTLAGNVGPDVGDVFWSDFHQTFLMVFMDSSISGQFWVSYSTDGGLTNWSKAEKLWQPLPNPTWKDECDASGMGGKWNYAGHAHPHWDPSGKTLLLSWSSCTVWVNMATLTWEGSTPEPLKPAAPVAAANTPSHAAAASTHIAAVPTTAPAATSVAPVVVAAASSSTAHTAATPDAKPQPLGLGSDGRIQFPAAQEAYKLRKRAAAAAVQSPPLRQDEIERRAVQTQRVQDRNRHFANHARIHRRRAERGATAAHGSVS
ncbi:hypothetical protein FH972_021978 [Carpinus fangiana]|uniref:DUF4185 domain-containing protein n=1 Tax=Carpinus fangiana TaxID=176857 RepID=A0A5N6KQW6_9ROSI|nr:hypothetical protein FH972_021978 [Carpinus fangiana]